VRPHHPNPAEADRRWRGERSKPVRLGVRHHHRRSLCAESPAQTVQWCCWFCRRRITFGPTCARGRGVLAAGPELRITRAAAQTRMVSVARIRPVSRKSTRLFKGIICDDIFEFESYMPSQAVRSLPANVPARLERQAGMLDGAGRSMCGAELPRACAQRRLSPFATCGVESPS